MEKWREHQPPIYELYRYTPKTEGNVGNPMGPGRLFLGVLRGIGGAIPFNSHDFWRTRRQCSSRRSAARRRRRGGTFAWISVGSWSPKSWGVDTGYPLSKGSLPTSKIAEIIRFRKEFPSSLGSPEIFGWFLEFLESWEMISAILRIKAVIFSFPHR